MESRRIAALAVVAAAVLVFILASSAFGCLPDDDGTCLTRVPGADKPLLDGGNSLVGAHLQVTLQTRKSDLLEFVDGTPNLSWRSRDRANLANPGFATPAQPIVYGMRVPSVATMPDSDLAHIETEILLREAPANLITLNRLKAVTQEIAKREQVIKTQWVRRIQALAPKPQPVAPAPAPALPGSADPFNAPAPSGQPVYIQPLTSVWYNISDRGRRLTMFIDANHQTGLVMSIYGPDQQDVWSKHPAGKGVPGEGHDFFWTGRSRFKGIWRIRLTNTNDFGVPYTFTSMAVSDKNGDLCRDCHGIIQDEWDRCEHEGSFCDDLKDQYAN